jgi:hypothetical protein
MEKSIAKTNRNISLPSYLVSDVRKAPSKNMTKKVLWDQGYHFISPRSHVKPLKEGQSSYNLTEYKHWKTKHDDKIIKDALN